MLLLSSCAGKVYLVIDPDLQEYITRFENDGDIKITNLVASFGNPGSNKNPDLLTVGVCKTGIGAPNIVILKSYWESIDDLQREQLMYHELGHCILDRNHDSRTINGCAFSIMHPYMISENCYEPARDVYVGELFNEGVRSDQSVTRGLGLSRDPNLQSYSGTGEGSDHPSFGCGHPSHGDLRNR